MISILENKYNLGHLFQYIVNLLSLIFRIIFFGSKKNNKKNIPKIIPILESDEEIGNYQDIYQYEHIPLNYSLTSKNDYSNMNYRKLKKD